MKMYLWIFVFVTKIVTIARLDQWLSYLTDQKASKKHTKSFLDNFQNKSVKKDFVAKKHVKKLS